MSLRDDAVLPERLFDSLDGCNVVAAGRMWRIEVYSVSDLDGRRWVQLALKGCPDVSLTMKLDAGTSERGAVGAIYSWLTRSAATCGL